MARVAAELWEESGLELNLDTEELSLYLAVTMKWDELEELGLGDVSKPRLKKGWGQPRDHHQGSAQPSAVNKVTVQETAQETHKRRNFIDV